MHPPAPESLRRIPPALRDETGAAILLAVFVILLFGVVALGGLLHIGAKGALARQQATGQSMSKIQAALRVYVAKTGQLPCPAAGSTGTGLSDCSVTTSNSVVPWKSLGLQQTEAVDSWGGQIGYAVTQSLTVNAPYNKSTSGGVPTNKIQVTVYNAVGASQSSGQYAYTLISYGADQYGAYLGSGSRKATAGAPVRESANWLDSAFASTSSFAVYPVNDGKSDPTAIFDHILVYETSSQLCSELNGPLSLKTYCVSSATASLTSQDANGGNFLGTTAGAHTADAKVLDAASHGSPTGTSPTVIYLGTPVAATSGEYTKTTIGTATQFAAACIWAQPSLAWGVRATDGTVTGNTLRAYFEFNLPYVQDSNAGDGFTFAILPSIAAQAPQVPCAQTLQASDMGFAGYGLSTLTTSDGSVRATTDYPAPTGYALQVPPMMGIEFDTRFDQSQGCCNPFMGSVGHTDQVNDLWYLLTGGGYFTTDNIRHDPVAEHMAALVIDSAAHNDNFHSSSTAVANAARSNNPSCDTPAVGGAAGGCSSDGTTFLTNSGSLIYSDANYHPVRIEITRNTDCTGGTGTSDIWVKAWIDCSNCSSVTTNLLDFPTLALPASAKTINYCVHDTAGSLYNTVMLGFTAAGYATTEGLMVRNFTASTQ